MPVHKKYSITSVNSVALGSTTLGATKSSLVSQFDDTKGEEKDYFYFERPGGDEKSALHSDLREPDHSMDISPIMGKRLRQGSINEL